MRKVYLTALWLCLSNILLSQPKGHLFIIGGGPVPEYLVENFVELAGGKDARFLVIPMASGEPEAAAASFSRKLLAAGCSDVKSLICSKESADNDSNFCKVGNAKGIFFTGGDQSKLTAALLGTKLLDSIRAIYNKGGVIGGTSAGAAVMSEVMITGRELLNKDSINAFNGILKGNIETVRGFGFLKGVIVDQHFLKRKRLNRLISLVLENRDLVGAGIDESTALIVNPDNSFSVMGESLVTILDARNAEEVQTDKNNHLSAKNIQVQLLKSGDKYLLQTIHEAHKVKK